MATAVSIPQPLLSQEIQEGIATRIAQAIPDLDEPVREAVKQAIMVSLTKTCSLNRTVYSKFSATWKFGSLVRDGKFCARWWVEMALDDFGRVTKPAIGGVLGPAHVDEIAMDVEGTIPEMPPDKFRRETQQPVPSPTVLKKPNSDANQATMSHTPRGPGRRRDV